MLENRNQMNEADEQEREQDADEADEPVGLRHLVVELRVARGDRFDDLRAARLHVVELHARAEVLVVDDVGLVEGEVDALLAVDDRDLGDRVAPQQLETLLGGDLLEAPEAADELERHDEHDDAAHDPDERAPEDALEVHETARLSP